MRHELRGLLKRDLFLLKSTVKIRCCVYVLSVILLNFVYAAVGNLGLSIYAISGITLHQFNLSVLMFPYHWIWMQIGAVLITFDFVRKDLYLQASSILVRLKSKKMFWISKALSGVWICAFLSLFLFCALYLTYRGVLNGSAFERAMEFLTQEAKYHFMCMYFLFCLYSVIVMVLPETVSFIVCMIILCLGLPVSSGMLPCNQFMLMRNERYDDLVLATQNGSVLYFAVSIIILITIGWLLIDRLDIFSEKGVQG